MFDACDPETGLCTPAGPSDASEARLLPPGRELVYIGDPMCSWCWGLSPALKDLAAFAEAEGLRFATVVGGLRPGGGDAWTPAFRHFLRHHWEEVHARTGQPFAFDLLDRSAFHYDTEPACRGFVVGAAMLRASGASDAETYAFFAALQERFYVQNEDPGDVAFYRPVVEAFGLDAEAFAERFASQAARDETSAQFRLVQAWGVRGFPTVLLRDGTRRTVLAAGFATSDALIARLRALQAA